MGRLAEMVSHGPPELVNYGMGGDWYRHCGRPLYSRCRSGRGDSHAKQYRRNTGLPVAHSLCVTSAPAPYKAV